jgi:hypothetical protein
MNFDPREYWVGYYSELGLEIPDGVLGSHPQQIFGQSELLVVVEKILYKNKI